MPSGNAKLIATVNHVFQSNPGTPPGKRNTASNFSALDYTKDIIGAVVKMTAGSQKEFIAKMNENGPDAHSFRQSIGKMFTSLNSSMSRYAKVKYELPWKKELIKANADAKVKVDDNKTQNRLKVKNADAQIKSDLIDKRNLAKLAFETTKEQNRKAGRDQKLQDSITLDDHKTLNKEKFLDRKHTQQEETRINKAIDISNAIAERSREKIKYESLKHSNLLERMAISQANTEKNIMLRHMYGSGISPSSLFGGMFGPFGSVIDKLFEPITSSALDIFDGLKEGIGNSGGMPELKKNVGLIASVLPKVVSNIKRFSPYSHFFSPKQNLQNTLGESKKLWSDVFGGYKFYKKYQDLPQHHWDSANLLMGENKSKRAMEFARSFAGGKGIKDMLKTVGGGLKKGLGTALAKVGPFALIAAGAALVAGSFGLMLKTTKKIFGFFKNCAKQAETIKNLVQLITTPFLLIYTLMAVPLLTTFIPIFKEMLSWITDNMDIIKTIGDMFATIFTEIFSEDNLGIVNKLMNGFATVMAFLGKTISDNMKTINTDSIASFIASTVTAIAGVIESILVAVVEFCYSAEGQALIVSVAEAFGRILGDLIVVLIAMLPFIIEVLGVTLIGMVEGMRNMLIKFGADILDNLDRGFGGLISGVVNGVIGMINNAIRFINGIIGIWGGHINELDRFVSFSSTAAGITNNSSISSIFNVVNNNNIGSGDMLKSILQTGGY